MEVFGGDHSHIIDTVFNNAPHQVFVKVNLYLILITTLVVLTLKLLVGILEPWNYVLDMTSRKYCKPIAEIDNSLRFQRGSDGEFHERSTPTTIQLFNCDSDSPTSNNSRLETNDLNNNNNNNTEQTILIQNRSLIYIDNNQLGSTNHVYPNGWIPIVESSRVKPGTIKRAIVFGKDLIVTRSIDGKEVNALDAYCPHMGVHIGIGGGLVKEVNNESCVECPFHGWTFRSSDGECVKIPYQKSNSSIPKQAKLATWHCVEVDNFIYIWHHIDKQPPNWLLKPSDLLKSENDWTLIGRSEHRTNLELRDVLENGADMNHFEGIHNDLFILGSNFSYLRPFKFLQQFTRHHWLPDWRPILDELGKVTHKAEMKLQSWISLFKLRFFDITVRAVQTGPARVDLYYNSNWYGKGLLIMNAIPLGGRHTKYVQHIYTKRTFFQCFMAKWVLYGEIKMLERDFFIWNHKKNIRNPIFVPEDKTLKQFRLWYSQFYKRKRKISIRDDDSNVGKGEKLISNCKNIDF